MPDLLPSPWSDAFDAMLDGCRSSLILTSPFVSRGPCDRIIARLSSRRPPVSIHLLTALSTDSLLSGSTDPVALLAMAESLPDVSVRYLPRLHAKVYISDESQAVVTSGNLTDGGLWRNYEYGVLISERETVARIRDDVLKLAALGSPISAADLRAMASATTDLRSVRKAAEATLLAELRQQFESRLSDLNEGLLRVRVGERSLNAVLSETVLYVLRRGPLPTPAIHREVQRIHPDLCDDTVDRVINGQHFGKKWKHAVRIAQHHLKQSGRIVLRDRLWRIA
jgi:hypothetical protein